MFRHGPVPRRSGLDTGVRARPPKPQLAPTSHSSGPRFAHDFSGIAPRAEIQVLTAPKTKLPPSPKPAPDEKPLGTLKDKTSGAEQKIYASFVPSGLWWMNGGVPTLDTLYPTTGNLPVGDLGKGTFRVKVTRGSDKIALDGGSTSLTGTDLTDVKLNTLAPSAQHKDVRVEVSHRAPGAKADTVHGADLEVRAPHHLDLLGTDHSPEGATGYLSLTHLRVFDNFKEPMPFIDVNEDFSAATFEKGVTSEWRDGFGARKKGSDITRDNAVFSDRYAASASGTSKGVTPAMSKPQSPLGKARVGSFAHDWYVGSATTGKGVHLSHHVGVFYSDHAEYTAFKSPIKVAKPKAASKP